MVGITVLQQIKQYEAGPGCILMVTSDSSDSVSVCFLVLIVLESLCTLTHLQQAYMQWNLQIKDIIIGTI